MKKEETIQAESTALIVQGPTGLTVDRKAVDAMYAEIGASIVAFEYDLTSEAGRKKIASLAYGIAKKRTSIESDKKKLKEGLLVQGRAIDGAWNEIKEKLEAFQETARKPLTDWETAEQIRQECIQRAFTSLQAVGNLLATDGAPEITKFLEMTEAYELDQITFAELYPQAVAAKNAAIASLKASLAKAHKDEADRAELVRLREESEARAKADKEAAEAAELVRLTKEREDREAKRLAELAEAARIAEEKRQAQEKANIEKAAKDAEERVKRELEAAAKKEADRVEAEHRAELKRISDEQDRVLRERQAEEKRKADEQAKVKAEADRRAAEEKKLAANKQHRTKVFNAAASAIVAGMADPIALIQAEEIIALIVDGKVPAVTLSFTA